MTADEQRLKILEAYKKFNLTMEVLANADAPSEDVFNQALKQGAELNDLIRSTSNCFKKLGLFKCGFKPEACDESVL